MCNSWKPRSLFAGFLIILFIAGATADSEDAQKFPPVSGEIYGQTAAGVKSILVNGKPAKVDADQNFRAAVNLKAGEKYLTLTINYEGLRIIKKYLIMRKEAMKTFKVFVPKEKIEKTIRAARPAVKIAAKKKKPIKFTRVKPKEKPKPAVKKSAALPTTYEYLYVWEFDRGQLLVVKRIEGKYSAEIYTPGTRQWKGLDELRDRNRP